MEMIIVALALGIAAGFGVVFVKCLEADLPWTRDMAKAMLLLNGVHVPADPINGTETPRKAPTSDDPSNDSERLAA